MATILELEVPTNEFALEATLTECSEAVIEIERVVADDPDRITPYVWAHADDFAALEAAFDDDPTVEELTLLSEMGEERSYQMTWTGMIDQIVPLLTDHEGTITHATGSVNGWSLRVLFPDRAALSEAHDYLKEAGFSLSIGAIYEAKDDGHIQHGLTETQHETIVAAFEAGYFTVPREVTQTELAEQLGLSHQALSEQLRRATGALVESTLITGGKKMEE
ncbi:helix-turn-helix domain-containing protein [Halalkalicoccus subterraneus]|uniref:helix-turn-helix domain-containing protein n=1 Tax=Halalkalicoccus subterraneus TaxID=2675002 RepID=UPI000EFAD90C|nr:bacterio-opsin activator domain-containing protein [Halalkalicoccus subterraneus]